VEWLTGDCIIRQQFNIGRCLFGDIFDTSSSTTSIMFVDPFLFYSRVKLNQLSPLVSVTRLVRLFLYSNPPFV